MTACASVVDVLSLAEHPARLSLERISKALHIGTDRARVVRQLAIDAVQTHAMARAKHPLGLSQSEVEAARLLRVTLP